VALSEKCRRPGHPGIHFYDNAVYQPLGGLAATIAA
jgi:hypothetical protein